MDEVPTGSLKIREFVDWKAAPDDEKGKVMVTTISYEHKENDTYLTIKQGNNKVFLTKEQVLNMLVKNGKKMVDRWKVNNGILRESKHG